MPDRETEVIGPVDLPLMSFDDDDDADAAPTKAVEEAAAKAAQEGRARAAEEARARAAEEAAAARAAEEAAAAKAAADADTASTAVEESPMEMGLLDEAIGEFQMVLRSTSDHLATYEMLGQTFLQKQEPEAALQSLTRGLDAPSAIEQERVGIYYYLGLAHETIGNIETAVEFYDKVFAIDINFADVTERLRGLRT